ncbi:MAG: DUF6288 domain-containing protein [Phycisphaeraceae bacterium]|nr:DUF6288 domain-containing protein [Phycisphaeraceae bacterium]
MPGPSRTPFQFMTGLVALALTATAAMAGALQIDRYYSDDMVLQRDKPAVIRGSADAGTEVTVTFAGQEKTATTDDGGTWTVTLDAMTAEAGGRQLQVKSSTGDTAILDNVVVGDVLLYARQTSIDVSLARTETGRKAARSFQPTDHFRAIRIQTLPAKQPVDQLAAQATDGWAPVSRDVALNMSAAAFYLGRDLQQKVDVPVGVIDVNMGPWFAIGWLSEQTLDASITERDEKELRKLQEWMRELADDRDSGAEAKEIEAEHQKRLEKARGRNHRVPPRPAQGIHPINNPMYPHGGYNAVIHPLRHIALHGVVLQIGADYPYIPYRRLAREGLAQDEAELNRAWFDNYMIMKLGYRTSDKTTPYLVGDWRRAFDDRDLPVGLVAPPSSDLFVYAEHNREMREMHRRIATENKNVGIILPDMANVDFSGQPANEQLLAARCLQWVLGDVYEKEDVVPSGPTVDRVEADLAEATIYFKPGTAEGLKALGEALDHFEAAAPGGEFKPAKAWVEGNTIKLLCPEVGQIEYVRYNWKTDPYPGLVNAAGLPAAPFNTDDRWQFGWFYRDKETELPIEYYTTADTWSDKDVAIINGEIDYLASGDSERIPRRPGPLGIYSSPFGPNIYVISIDPGTPAVGKLLPGDYIYGVNGEKFEAPDDPMYHQLAAAINEAESEPGEGKLDLMVRRGKKLIDVTLDLPVLGTYSPTSPYYCKKTRTIIRRAEQWSYQQFRPEAGPAKNVTGFLGTDLWFLLATGNPEVQGLVRRAVYEMMEEPLREPDPYEPNHNWNIGYDGVLLGEYYHATGDPNVLAHLKNRSDWAAVTQIKEPGPEPVPWEVAQADEHAGGWRQRYNPNGADRWKSGYGLMPPAGTACLKGIIFAREAGLDYDQAAFERGVRHFRFQRAEHAFVEYLYWNLRRESPPMLRPEAEANGMLSSLNGKLGQAAALFRLLDDHQVVEICSRYNVYAYNNTRYGHGGMFFNNFWTPIGAHAAGKPAFQHFMQGQTWWRDLYRRADGAFKQVGRGGIGVAYALHYVAPRKRMRILGAPKSAFGVRGEEAEYLQPALAAHRERDYARCQQLLLKTIEETAIAPEDRPMVDHFLESVRILRQSIDHDLTYVEQQIAEGNYDYAAAELPQLKGVVAADNPRLKLIIEKLESPQVQEAMPRLARQRREEAEAEEARLREGMPAKPDETWVNLTPDDNTEDADPAVWKMKLVEDRVQAPEGWADPDFDDADWDDATMPISWAMYHTALFRADFNLEDPSQFDKLRFRGGFFQQGNVMVYINGELVAKVDNIGRGAGMSDGLFTDYAVELLKKGQNTVAVTTRHKRRWGPLRGGKFTTAAGFTFMLDAREKDEE